MSPSRPYAFSAQTSHSRWRTWAILPKGFSPPHKSPLTASNKRVKGTRADANPSRRATPQGQTDGRALAHIFGEFGYPDSRHPYIFLGGYIDKGLARLAGMLAGRRL